MLSSIYPSFFISLKTDLCCEIISYFFNRWHYLKFYQCKVQSIIRKKIFFLFLEHSDRSIELFGYTVSAHVFFSIFRDGQLIPLNPSEFKMVEVTFGVGPNVMAYPMSPDFVDTLENELRYKPHDFVYKYLPKQNTIFMQNTRKK